MLYAFGFIGLFTIGGLTGLFLATMAIDVHVTDTYFVIAHFHYVMVGGMVMAYLGGIHFWFPKITGRLYPEGWAKFAALVIFVGFNLTFFPQFILGYLGMPRRYATYAEEFQVLNVMSTAGASILGVGYLIPMIYLAWAWRHGPISPQNPWNAKGLEWEQSPTPPPTFNFDRAAGGHRACVQLLRREEEVRAWLIASHPAPHAPELQHHFDDVAQQLESSTLGMWVFLVTEIMFFGGMFAGYTVYRNMYPEAFASTSHFMNVTIGAINTARADLQQLHHGAGGARRATRPEEGADLVLDPDAILGCVFLGLKYVEYHEKWVDHHIPGPGFHYADASTSTRRRFCSSCTSP